MPTSLEHHAIEGETWRHHWGRSCSQQYPCIRLLLSAAIWMQEAKSLLPSNGAAIIECMMKHCNDEYSNAYIYMEVTWFKGWAGPGTSTGYYHRRKNLIYCLHYEEIRKCSCSWYFAYTEFSLPGEALSIMVIESLGVRWGWDWEGREWTRNLVE